MLNRIVQAARGAALIDVWGAIGLSLKYMARPKATVNSEFGPSTMASTGQASWHRPQ